MDGMRMDLEEELDREFTLDRRLYARSRSSILMKIHWFQR